MLPPQLTAAHFRRYPPRARELAASHLLLLRQLPLAFLPSFLRELIDYDYKFPAERAELDGQLGYLAALSAAQLGDCFSAFARLRLSSTLEEFAWIDEPLLFTEHLSAHLWSTGQMDAFRSAATVYGNRLQAAIASPPPSLPRLGIAVIGRGASPTGKPLFLNLRKHGTYFSAVKPDDGFAHLLGAVETRAQKHPVPYGHWYVDGALPTSHSSSLTCVSYGGLATTRDVLLSRIQQQVAKPGMGPEELRNFLARLSPGDLGMHGDAVLDRFQVRLLTEGSGTQIFSTTFAQWAARESLRRAAPLSLLVRFAPRQRQRPMNELLSSTAVPVEMDPAGSLIDADMAAYYHWINQQRLSGADQSSFLVWFEEQRHALAIGPTLPRGTESRSPLDIPALLSLLTA